MKKILWLIAVAAVLVLMVACPALAEIVDSGTCGRHLEWTLSDSGVLTISGSGTIGDECKNGEGEWDYCETDEYPWYAYRMQIKSVVIGEGVRGLTDKIFSGYTELTDVSLSGTVPWIGGFGFANCSKLESIVLPSGMLYIGGSLFMNCVSLRNVTIPETIIEIADYAFDGCANLESIALPAGLDELCEYTFRGCAKLKSVTIPSGIKTIGNGTFADCAALETIDMPAAIDTISLGSFSGCNALRQVNYAGTAADAAAIKCFDETLCSVSWVCSDGTTLDGLSAPVLGGTCGDDVNWKLENGVLTLSGTGATYYFDEERFWPEFNAYADQVSSIVIENGVTYIGCICLKGMRNAVSVSIPASVVGFGDEAFACCESLKSVTIPDGVMSLPQACFLSCTSLESIVLPENLTEIGGDCFAYTGFSEITIPGSVESVRGFYGCENLVSVTINDGVTSITGHAFSDCDVRDLYLPSSIRVIGEYVCDEPDIYGEAVGAFEDNDHLYELTYGGTMEEARNVVLYDKVLQCCVWHCTDGDFLPTIEDGGTFGDFSWQISGYVLTISGTGAIPAFWPYDEYADYDYVPWNNYLRRIKTINISEGVTGLGEGNFEDCFRMTTVNLPASVTSIGKNCFAGCDSLATVNYAGTMADKERIDTALGNDDLKNARWICSDTPNDHCGDNVLWALGEDGVLTVYGEGAMYDFSEGTAPWAGSKDEIRRVIVASGVTSVGDYAFANYPNLTIVKLASSVLRIGEYAFSGCTNLIDVERENVTVSGDTMFEAGAALTTTVEPGVGAHAFENCDKLKSVDLPQTAEVLGESCFKGCAALREVDIPDSVNALGDSCFSGCESLETVNMPDTLDTLGAGCFENCAALTEVTVPEGVTELGENVFSGCTSLATVNMPDTLESIGAGCFDGCETLTELTIPDSVKEVSGDAFGEDKAPKYVQGYDSDAADALCKAGFMYRVEGDPLTYDKTFEDDALVKWIVASCDATATGKVTVPAGITDIAENAFADCTAVTAVALPKSLEYVGMNAFADCAMLNTVDYAGLIQQKERIEITNGNEPLMNANWAYAAAKVMSLPASLKEIKAEAFAGIDADWVVIPESVSSVGSRAFADCENLVVVEFKGKPTSVASDAFEGCMADLDIRGLDNSGN